MIHFSTLRFKNFLSYGQAFTEIPLDAAPTTLVVGHNGSGKSTLLDALTFVLFNKPFRKVNKGQLVNSMNEKDCVVEVEFQIGKKEYMIRRGIKPNIFEIYCDGTMINQDSKSKDYQKNLEEQILKMNYKTFTQVVILGSSNFVPFMQLSSPDRRSIIEDLLDIQIFTRMNVILKQRMASLREETIQLEADLRIARERISMQEQYIDSLKRDKKKLITTHKNKLEECDDRISKLNERNEAIIGKVDKLRDKLGPVIKLEQKFSKTTEMRGKIKNKVKRTNKQMEFFTDNDTCPTCTQNIDKTLTEEMIQKNNDTLQELNDALDQLDNSINKMEKQFEKVDAIQKKISALQDKSQQVNSDIAATSKYRQQIVATLEELKEEDGKSITAERKKLKELEKEHKTAREDKDVLVDDKHYLDIVGILLKDSGIKTKIISQYLPIMNQTINKYLNMLDFPVSFELNESFEESIKSRYRDEFSYSSFSEGEKQRIDLALLFTWRDIAKMRNSANTNLLILDEVFDSSLDTNGTEEFMKLLKTLTKKTNTLIISHHGDALYDKFNACIRFEKRSSFSTMKYEGNSHEG